VVGRGAGVDGCWLSERSKEERRWGYDGKAHACEVRTCTNRLTETTIVQLVSNTEQETPSADHKASFAIRLCLHSLRHAF
jgi:hypothetical protein